MAGNNNLLNNFNSTQKNNFFQVSLNPMISSFNNNMTANSEASNFGNNNIIFNNYGSINNNIFIENPKKNYFEENQSSNNKITSEEKHKEKVIRDFKFLKENTLKEETNTKEDLDDKEIRNKQRAFSTVPYKALKNSK